MKTTYELIVLDALKTAVRALCATPSFGTGIANPEAPGRSLTSYQLIPKLEEVIREFDAK